MALAMIAKMNLAAIDLNLLVAFEALMRERHVTRAGQRIGLAQPSMSSALARLRVVLGDRLFIRNGKHMQPTPRALALAMPIGAALDQIRRTLDPNRAFDPATAQTRFTIATTDYGSVIVLPKVVSAIRREAPGIDLSVYPLTDPVEAGEQLERGAVDVLICGRGRVPASPRIVLTSLFMERVVCIRDAARAAGEAAIGTEDFISLPHAWFDAGHGKAVAWEGPEVSPKSGAAPGRTHRVALTLPHIVAVPFAVAGTDLIGLLSERVARRFAAAAGVSIVALSYETPLVSIDVMHARNRGNDTAVRWLVDLIIRESSDL